ncbi:MAG: GTPase ObgE [Thermomicrobiales bacterium]|nr:GTPase ObgE [Thermomicrobiales bacterium]
MLVDRARIRVTAGNGGRGVVSFRREKFVPMGGPDGGDGGRGGNVVLRVDPQMATLLPFQYTSHFRAGHGQAGRHQNMYGKTGETVYVDVPAGTIVIDDETDEPIADLIEPDDELIIARGGKGGLGNAHFTTSTRQAPRISELGEPGEERWIRLELKLIADVGLVGFPNAGKSTLLAAASAAKPKIADYPFTTLEPNLGVVEVGGRRGDTFVLADIPGLIEGAAEGVGLGHEFLRHVERTRLLLHVIDGSGGMEDRDPIQDFDIIDQELRAYSDELGDKPRFLAINKIDLPDTQVLMPLLHEALDDRVERVFEISGVTGEGVKEMMFAIYERLRDIPKLADLVPPETRRVYTLETENEDLWEAERLSRHHYSVTGRKIERTLAMTDFASDDAADRFQRILEASGISAQLEALGVEPGDTVHIGDAELIWDQAAVEDDELDRERRTHRQRLEDSFEGEIVKSGHRRRQKGRTAQQRKR